MKTKAYHNGANKRKREKDLEQMKRKTRENGKIKNIKKEERKLKKRR